MYYHGIGIEKDFETAFDLYEVILMTKQFQKYTFENTRK
jgi:TPR repeat protein